MASDMDAIRARLRAALKSGGYFSWSDVDALLAENERLEGRIAEITDVIGCANKNTERAKAEVTRLTAEVERLQARVEEEEGNYVSALERGDGFSRRAEQAEAALAIYKREYDLATDAGRLIHAALPGFHDYHSILDLVKEALAALAAANERIADCAAGVKHCGLGHGATPEAKPQE